MKIEEAIKWMEETIQDAEGLLDKCSPALKEEVLEQNEVFKIAISALRSMQEAGEPLSLEQLREVPHGKIKDSTLQNIANRANEIASPPAHIDRSEWISVKERLPEAYYGESDNVLVVDEIGIRKILYFDGGCWCYPTGETYDRKVTHWMPLPEPPEEG